MRNIDIPFAWKGGRLAIAWKQKGAVPFYQEKGTYVGYVKVEPEVMRMQAAPQALCPVQPSFDPLPVGSPASPA